MNYKDLRQPTSAIGTTGRKSEKKTASRLGAHLTPASGALDGAKSDMVAGEFRVEAKSTTKKSFSLLLKHLVKVSNEAQARGQTPALSVTFVNDDGTPVRSGAWVVIPEWLFKELLENADAS